MNTNDFLELITKEFGNLAPEEGIRYKYFEDEIRGIAVCWMISNKVLNFTIKKKWNLIVAHEDLFFPPDYVGGKGEGIISLLRKEILEKYRINFVRFHYTTDKYFILDVFDALSGGEVLIKENFYRIYSFKNVNFNELVKQIKKRYKIKFLRVLEKHKTVKKAGCLWGGLGLSLNAFFIDKILSFKVDTVIAGEVDEYTIRTLDDLNINIIEIGHEASETPGLLKFTEFLKKKIPNIPIKYIKNPYLIKIVK